MNDCRGSPNKRLHRFIRDKGWTRKESAIAIGVPEGTLKCWLSAETSRRYRAMPEREWHRIELMFMGDS